MISKHIFRPRTCTKNTPSKNYKSPEKRFFLRAESFYNVATEVENLDNNRGALPSLLESYGGKSLHEQSHGESFFSLFLHRFGGEGLYILDESEAALSNQRQLAFLSRLHQLVEDGSQFIIATHSPIVLSYPNAKILEIRDNCVAEVAYEETEQFSSMKLFINHYPNILRRLFD